MKESLKKLDLFTIILIILLVIVSFCYAQLKIFKKQYINFAGYTVFQVITGSMSGAIEIKDIVIVKLTDDINENDIITFKYKENFVTHRVIKIDDEKIVTKGDANDSEDEPIKKSDIVGKVVYIIPNISIWLDVLKTPQVIIAIMITIITTSMLFRKKDVKN